MPFACMCIIFNSPVLYKFCFLYRMFLRTLFFTDTDCDHFTHNQILLYYN